MSRKLVASTSRGWPNQGREWIERIDVRVIMHRRIEAIYKISLTYAKMSTRHWMEFLARFFSSMVWLVLFVIRCAHQMSWCRR